ncbi:regulatory protein recx [Phtheirospermum japonicum]|uniref:Regulatory protein RecX n=1 Tax=Phtheirospermum japonicum TaxID=374723 RepID=A0A830BNI0_9LAMI|nr:regulatory protein recx [Phtheirospermum japonicum]
MANTWSASYISFKDFIFRAKRDNAIIRCCAEGRRDYSSSFPVKYIPKKTPENKENGPSSLPVKYTEKSHNGPELDLEKRVNFPKNSSSSFSDINSKNHGAVRASGINYGLNLGALNDEFIEEPEDIVEDSSKACSGIQSGNSRQAVEKLAIELLASRAFTALELKKKLQAKKFALEIVDDVITDFQSRGLINDCLYAEAYSRSRWSSSSWGPRRIRQALSKKGISEVDTQNAIKQVFESEDQDSGINMSKLSIDQLYAQASKQWQRSQGVSQDTRKSRIIRWLQYRGFNWNVTSYVLKKLESENH